MDIRQTVLDDCSYGLYIVCSQLNGKLNGQITDALMQVTAFPPRVAVSINKDELTHEFIRDSGVFAVTILSRSADLPFVGLFGFRSGRDVDKLSQVEHKIGETGCPLVIENAVAVFEAQVIETVDLGTHTMFAADVLSGEIIADAPPLTYRYYKRNLKGKVSRNSPSYSDEATPGAGPISDEGAYVCDVCGYVYAPAIGDPVAGVPPGVSFDDLPDDWVCPICGVGKDQFTPRH